MARCWMFPSALSSGVCRTYLPVIDDGIINGPVGMFITIPAGWRQQENRASTQRGRQDPPRRQGTPDARPTYARIEMEFAMPLEKNLMDIERQFWTGGPNAYAAHTDKECLVVFKE